MTEKKSCSARFYILAFFIPVFLLLLIYAATDIYPFGDKILLTIDMNNQYISFFSYLRGILKGTHSIFYSFSKTLGGDLIGLTAYYLMSPLNFILLFFDTASLPNAVEIITVLKVGLSGCAFYFCTQYDLSKTKESRLGGLIFSICYALMSYNIVYQQNLMWMDDIILLPFIITGIRMIFKKKSPLLYISSLSAAILLNYYIGYMLCIFSVLFFLYSFFFVSRKGRFWDFRLIFTYGFSSLLSGGLSMILICPVLKSLQGGKAGFSLSNLHFHSNFHWSDFLVKFFIGSFDYQEIQTGLPNVYCGIISLLFLGIFFLSRSISLRKKVGALLFFIILYLSFFVDAFNLIWHGLNYPSWFPYRYSFVFSFLILILAWEGFLSLKQTASRPLVFSCTACMVIFAGITLWMRRKNFAFMTDGKFFLSFLLLVFGVVLILMYQRQRQLFTVLLLCVVSAELALNGIYSLSVLYYQPRENWNEYINKMEPAVSYVKSQDSGFYRMERTITRTHDDSMLLDFSGLSHYSSSEKNLVKYFMGQLGFHNHGIWVDYYNGSTYAMDSLLGVKYLLTDQEIPEYKLLETIGEVKIYQNPYALSMGYLADDTILDFDITSPMKFEVTNNLFSAIDNTVNKKIFKAEPTDAPVLTNLSQLDANNYVKEDPEKEASIRYTFTAENTDPVYAFFGSADYHAVTVDVNETSFGDYMTDNNRDLLNLGSFKKGEKVTVTLTLKEDQVNITAAWFYYQNMNVFQEYYENLNSGSLDLTKESDTHITGSFTNSSDKEYAMFSFPYEESWHVYVDGKETETAMGGGVFLAAKIPSGTHTIELIYKPAGLTVGIVISLTSLLTLVVWMLLWRKKKTI